jgi:hypothetical protein
MGLERKYGPAEFGFATGSREREVRVTIVLNRTDWDYLQVLIRNRAFGYRDTDDVIRESIHRQINLLLKSSKAKCGFSTPDILDAVIEARLQIKERDLCIVLEIFRGLAIHSLSGKSDLVHLLASILKHKVQRVQSKHLRETYLRVIDEIMSLTDGSRCSRVPHIASLNPATFEDGPDAEE